MNLVKKVDRFKFYTDFVNILNGVLQLSNRESEVFSLLLHYSDNGYEDNVNHKVIRDQIKTYLNISEANLSRYLNTIKSKGLIIKGSRNKWVVNDNIKPVVENDTIEIKFVLKLEDIIEENTKINKEYSKE